MASSRPRAIQPVAGDLGKINIILYGEPGVGKSMIACSGEKTLILAHDNEETVSSAANADSTADKWVCKDYNDLLEAYEYLRHSDHDYRWVWLDNATLFQEQGMDQIMEELVAEKPSRSRFIPDVQQYLENQQRLAVWIRNAKGLPMNFGMTAHVMRREDPDSGEITLIPLLQGKDGEYSQKICGYMNVIGYVSRRRKEGKDETTLMTNKRSRYFAKDRFGALGTMVNPTIPQIEAKIQAKVKSKGTTKKAPARRTRRPAAT